MSAIFPNPLSNDGVDKLNYKYMVLLLLLLALISFMVPLHPVYQDQNQNEAPTKSGSSRTMEGKAVGFPRVGVACWCPVEFTRNYVNYANTYCENSFNAMMRGEETDNIHLVTFDVPIPLDGTIQFMKTTRDYFKRKLEKMYERKGRNVEASENFKARVHKLVTYETPIMLFVVGISLALPQAVWAFLSDCLSTFNVGKTLRAAERVNVMDTSRRKQALEDLSAGISNSLRSSSRTTTVLYLFKKISFVIVVLVLIIITTQHILPEVEELYDAFSNGASKSIVHEELHDDLSSEISDAIVNTTGNPYRGFICAFKIKQLQNIQSWTAQCIIHSVIGAEQNEENGGTSSRSALKNEKEILEFESTMFTIVVEVLAILLVIDVASLLIWIAKLVCSPCTPSLGLPYNTAKDIIFLLHMARINASAPVRDMLGRSFTDDNHGINLDDVAN